MANGQSVDAAVVETILKIRKEVETLRELGSDLPCVERNCQRLLASVAMLELDVVDVARLLEGQDA